MKTEHIESSFDQLACDYDRWYEEKDGKIIFASEVKALQEILPALPQPWLEAGVGSGRFAKALGISTGVDPAGRLLAKAKSRGIMTLQGKIEDRFLPLESFGAVFLIMTLCFMEKPDMALKEVNRILKPGGKIVLGEVPVDSSWGTLYQRKKKDSHPLYKHAVFHTYEELQNLLKQTGFALKLTVSTLFQKPGKLTTIESPLNDYYEDAGFLVLVGAKSDKPFER
ncbi:MAG: class I SAM-dependent methyltransferase [Dehalococcoidia bacterium]|nr:class I SAM-dependent methyltransferase [Dehalococcoidia bacterium]